MSTTTDNLLDWLRDAHAMEQQAEKMLTAQSERLEHYPELKARIVQHIDETRGQRELLSPVCSVWEAARRRSRTYPPRSLRSVRRLPA